MPLVVSVLALSTHHLFLALHYKLAQTPIPNKAPMPTAPVTIAAPAELLLLDAPPAPPAPFVGVLAMVVLAEIPDVNGTSATEDAPE
jgi:hypothetical protein